MQNKNILLPQNLKISILFLGADKFLIFKNDGIYFYTKELIKKSNLKIQNISSDNSTSIAISGNKLYHIEISKNDLKIKSLGKFNIKKENIKNT